MKQLYFFIIACCFISCGKKHSPAPVHGTQITVVYNVTERLASPPLPEPILSLFDFNIDKGQQADFKIVLLHGTLLNAAESAHLDGICINRETTAEDIESHAQITTSFSNAVYAAIFDFPKQYGTGTVSARLECYATIAQELEQLAGSAACQRILIVYGAAENDPAFSSRSLEGKELLRTNPKKVIELLQKRRKLLDNLVGISVYFVTDGSEDDIGLIRLYQRLLRDRGARVIIQSSNKHFL